MLFYCPGCDAVHGVNNAWQFNNDYEKPTFSPSVLVRTGHYSPEHKSDQCWCTYNITHKDDPAPYRCAICHSFVKEGKIQFLSDCSHSLADQTVDLPEFD